MCHMTVTYNRLFMVVYLHPEHAVLRKPGHGTGHHILSGTDSRLSILTHEHRTRILKSRICKIRQTLAIDDCRNCKVNPAQVIRRSDAGGKTYDLDSLHIDRIFLYFSRAGVFIEGSAPGSAYRR